MMKINSDINFEEFERLNEKILSCPNYLKVGGCEDVTDVSSFNYKHGPELAYVGTKYGQPNTPRILFTRLNCPWYNFGWFGTKESIQDFKSANPDCNFNDIQMAYLQGWKNSKKYYRGLQDAGTVIGYSNQRAECNQYQRNTPKYGIQLIMKEMISEGIFPNADENPLYYCAINNLIKCSGSGKGEKSHPTKLMAKFCNYYQQELKILKPHVLVVMGGDTHKLIKKRFKNNFLLDKSLTYLTINGNKILYWRILHPTGQGKNTWVGKGVEHLTKDNGFQREFTEVERKRYYKIELFYYVLRLVQEVKKIKKY